MGDVWRLLRSWSTIAREALASTSPNPIAASTNLAYLEAQNARMRLALLNIRDQNRSRDQLREMAHEACCHLGPDPIARLEAEMTAKGEYAPVFDPVAEASPSNEVVIYSGEHGSYWRDGGIGYTVNIEKAGRWSRGEAEAQTAHCGPEKKIEIRPAPVIRDLLAEAIAAERERCAKIAENWSETGCMTHNLCIARAIREGEKL
jgi:hypothetical protein